MTLRTAWLAVSLTLAALAAPGLATAGDASRGAKLAYTCHGCHGIPNYKNAYPIYSVPKLGGQHPLYLVNALKEYASLDRNHPTMHAHAVTMSAQDMDDITTYLTGQSLKSTGRAVGTAVVIVREQTVLLSDPLLEEPAMIRPGEAVRAALRVIR